MIIHQYSLIYRHPCDQHNQGIKTEMELQASTDDRKWFVERCVKTTCLEI